jgi:hypothetical protein
MLDTALDEVILMHDSAPIPRWTNQWKAGDDLDQEWECYTTNTDYGTVAADKLDRKLQRYFTTLCCDRECPRCSAMRA